MATRNILFQKPTVEIDQDRYEELIRNELKYEQYRDAADTGIRDIIEHTEVKLIESEEK